MAGSFSPVRGPPAPQSPKVSPAVPHARARGPIGRARPCSPRAASAFPCSVPLQALAFYPLPLLELFSGPRSCCVHGHAHLPSWGLQETRRPWPGWPHSAIYLHCSVSTWALCWDRGQTWGCGALKVGPAVWDGGDPGGLGAPMLTPRGSPDAWSRRGFLPPPGHSLGPWPVPGIGLGPRFLWGQG